MKVVSCFKCQHLKVCAIARNIFTGIGQINASFTEKDSPFGNSENLEILIRQIAETIAPACRYYLPLFDKEDLR